MLHFISSNTKKSQKVKPEIFSKSCEFSIKINKKKNQPHKWKLSPIMKIRQKKLVFIDFSYVFEAFFSIITPRRSIPSRRFIRNMIDNFEKVENFELLEYKAYALFSGENSRVTVFVKWLLDSAKRMLDAAIWPSKFY
jgi:hypothetical protein